MSDAQSEAQHPCPQCDKTYKTKGGLARHVKSKHATAPPPPSPALSSTALTTSPPRARTPPPPKRFYRCDECNAYRVAIGNRGWIPVNCKREDCGCPIYFRSILEGRRYRQGDLDPEDCVAPVAKRL